MSNWCQNWALLPNSKFYLFGILKCKLATLPIHRKFHGWKNNARRWACVMMHKRYLIAVSCISCTVLSWSITRSTAETHEPSTENVVPLSHHFISTVRRQTHRSITLSCTKCFMEPISELRDIRVVQNKWNNGTHMLHVDWGIYVKHVCSRFLMQHPVVREKQIKNILHRKKEFEKIHTQNSPEIDTVNIMWPHL